MVKGYFVSAILLVLGLLGAGTIALQASRSLAEPSGARAATEPGGDSGSAQAMRPTPVVAGRPVPSRKISAHRPAPTPDAGAPATQPAPTPDAGALATQPAPAPDAGAPAIRPAPTPSGPAPALVVEFDSQGSRTTRTHRRDVRKLVEQHGYKGVTYLLTAYAAERHKPRYNRTLARKRCRRVSRLIRKRGVSRRWIKCLDPVYRKTRGKAKAEHLAPTWRRVVIQVKR